MYHFNKKRFIKVIDDALGNDSKIEKTVDVLFEKEIPPAFLFSFGLVCCSNDPFPDVCERLSVSIDSGVDEFRTNR